MRTRFVSVGGAVRGVMGSVHRSVPARYVRREARFWAGRPVLYGLLVSVWSFDDFKTSSVPKDGDTYREYRRRTIEFVEARNRRIDRYAARPG